MHSWKVGRHVGNNVNISNELLPDWSSPERAQSISWLWKCSGGDRTKEYESHRELKLFPKENMWNATVRSFSHLSASCGPYASWCLEAFCVPPPMSPKYCRMSNDEVGRLVFDANDRSVSEIKVPRCFRWLWTCIAYIWPSTTFSCFFYTCWANLEGATWRSGHVLA